MMMVRCGVMMQCGNVIEHVVVFFMSIETDMSTSTTGGLHYSAGADDDSIGQASS